MPEDSKALRDDLTACLPSLLIDQVAAESGQRVVYFGRFNDALIPETSQQTPPFSGAGKLGARSSSRSSRERATKLSLDSKLSHASSAR